jgi:conjugal transfer pilus assembly protein TraU
MDMDLMYTSPVDPTWNDDELAFFLNAEAAWAGTPVAQAAQIPDCLAASAGDSIEKFFWTAGCWGNLYPFTGNIDHEGSPPRDSNLIATRAVAALHRRGLARKTMGDDAMCKGDIYPMIPKSQYKWSMLYPIPEVKGDENLAPGDASASGRDVAVKGSHVTGESTFLWGEWRNIPAVGEDFTYLLWRWNDCCMR